MVGVSQSKFILSMFNSIMSLVAIIEKPFITLKSTGIFNCYTPFSTHPQPLSTRRG